MAGVSKPMLDADDVVCAAARRLGNHFWDVEPSAAWPWAVSLRLPTGSHLPEVPILLEWAEAMRDFCSCHSLECVEAGRNVGVTGLTYPSRVVIPSEAVAATICGRSDDVARRERLVDRVEGTGLSHDIAVEVARGLWKSSDDEVSALLKLGVWARTHVTAGLTSRQLPVPGVQGKTLNDPSKRSLVARIAGVRDLGLVDRRYLVSVRHLDPWSRTRFGLALPGGDFAEEAAPDYGTSRLIIVENRDTFLNFPLIRGGTCVLGDGKACIPQLTHLSWVMDATPAFYWGDMDLDGLLILSSLRGHGLACKSILMDIESFRRYEHLGTSLDKRNHPIDVSRYPTDPVSLTEDELSLYHTIRDGGTPVKRIEQERIPYDDALKALGWID